MRIIHPGHVTSQVKFSSGSFELSASSASPTPRTRTAAPVKHRGVSGAHSSAADRQTGRQTGRVSHGRQAGGGADGQEVGQDGDQEEDGGFVCKNQCSSICAINRPISRSVSGQSNHVMSDPHCEGKSSKHVYTCTL